MPFQYVHVVFSTWQIKRSLHVANQNHTVEVARMERKFFEEKVCFMIAMSVIVQLIFWPKKLKKIFMHNPLLV